MTDASREPLCRLLYMSTAAHFHSEQELEELLQQARAKNQAVGITGMLIYVEGHFLQYLEGPKEEIETLVSRLEGDSRHRGIIRLMQGPIDHRTFADWSMGYRALGKDEGSRVLGAVNLAKQSLRSGLPSGTPEEIALFMESFYRSSLGFLGDERLGLS